MCNRSCFFVVLSDVSGQQMGTAVYANALGHMIGPVGQQVQQSVLIIDIESENDK